MPVDGVRYPRYRLSAAIISHAVWLYDRFALSFRDVEDLLAHRGITVSYQSIRHWCETFGAACSDTWHLDEPFVTIRGQRHYCGGPSTRTARSSTSCCRRVGSGVPQCGISGSY
jgi:transposase-like protein